MVTREDFASALIMVTVIFTPWVIHVVPIGGKDSDPRRGTGFDFL